MILVCDVPHVRAASMNCCSFMLRVRERTNRIRPGQPTTAKTTMSVMRRPAPAMMASSALPYRLTTMSASVNPGKANTRSVKRESRVSISPPKYPATTPRIVPRIVVMAAPTSPASKGARSPYSSRLYWSRPRLSVPNQCCGPGPRSSAS